MFLILKVARTTEVRKAKWDEFDFEKGLWVIPVQEGRLGKTKKPNIVPSRIDSKPFLKEFPLVFNTRSTSIFQKQVWMRYKIK